MELKMRLTNQFHHLLTRHSVTASAKQAQPLTHLTCILLGHRLDEHGADSSGGARCMHCRAGLDSAVAAKRDERGVVPQQLRLATLAADGLASRLSGDHYA